MGTTRGPAGRERPTLADVARLAGVSPMTASRALNSEKYVSSQASAKVRAAAEELGFVPHHGARSLATQRSETVGMILPMAGTHFFNDPNIAPLIAGASAKLDDLGSQLVVLTAGNARQAEKVRRFVLARHVDGVLVVSPEIIGDMMTDLTTAKVPMAVTGFDHDGPTVDWVDVDTAAAVRTAYAHLAERGCRRISLIAGGRDNIPTLVQARAFTEVGGGEIAYGDYSERSGRIAMRELLARQGDVDGIVVMSDVMARGALQVLREAGRSVPGHVRVIGYDDSAAAAAAHPALSTIRVPFEKIGAEMARLVLERLSDPSAQPRHVRMPTELVVREST